MSRNALIALTIGAIIVLGAIAAFLYSYTRPTTDDVNPSKMASKVDESSKNGISLSSIADVFSKGDNVRCTFEVDAEEGSTSGTVYVSDENARGEFTTVIDDEEISTYMVRNDDTFYMWGDSLPTGMKMVMSIDEWSESIQDTQGESEATSFDPNAQVDFKCSAWNVDNSLFEAPSDVKFISIEGSFGEDTATMKMTDDSETATPSIPCNLCESLTGDAKNLCTQNCQ